MELDEELDLQFSQEDIDVGEDHSDINDSDTEGEEDEDSTPKLVVLEQEPGARNSRGAATTSTGVGAPGNSAGGSAGSNDGGSASSGAGGAEGGGRSDRDVGAEKELKASAAKVKQWVKDWGLTTPSTAKATIWQKG